MYFLPAAEKTVSAAPLFPHQFQIPNPVECETSVITDVDNPEDLFCPYIAESLCKKTGQRVLCTGGIFVENPDEHQIDKLYENVDEMIMDWVHFLD